MQLDKCLRYILLIVFSFLSFTITIAQNKAKVLKTGIENQLELLQTFPQTIYDDTLLFDPDSLSKSIANNTVEYLNEVGFDNFRKKDLLSLEINTDINNSPFSIISFGYDSGGTAGTIPTSIIVKKEKGGYKYYNMAGYEANFYEFYQLKDNIYICFATVPGWGACLNQQVSVFEFGNELKPIAALNDSDSFSICNSSLSFDRESMLLTIDTDVEEADFSSNKEVLTIFENNNWTDSKPNTERILISKFNGQKFMKP